MGKQVWKKIYEKGTWTDFDWVLKLDADAVFVKTRLQKVLAAQPVSWTGTYVENCEGVQYGFFGNVEVLSHKAFETLVQNLDSCSESIKWASMTATAWGPIEEELGGEPKEFQAIEGGLRACCRPSHASIQDC